MTMNLNMKKENPFVPFCYKEGQKKKKNRKEKKNRMLIKEIIKNCQEGRERKKKRKKGHFMKIEILYHFDKRLIKRI